MAESTTRTGAGVTWTFDGTSQTGEVVRVENPHTYHFTLLSGTVGVNLEGSDSFTGTFIALRNGAWTSLGTLTGSGIHGIGTKHAFIRARSDGTHTGTSSLTVFCDHVHR